MILLLNPCIDPARNLALEEYLLTRRCEDFFMVWQNRPSIIVGRNQNPFAQINHDYVQRHHIPVFRRITGGGSVYHDLGNVNFTMIRTIQNPYAINFNHLLGPVIEFLDQMGVAVHLEGQSDLAVPGGKISGNAQHLHKSRGLHHGTLLYDTDLGTLSHALSKGSGKYIDRSVDSIRKQVTNLRPLLKTDLSAGTFMRRFLTFFQKKNPGAFQTALSMAEQGIINGTAQGKYNSWEWNFARSPDYRFETVLESMTDQLKIQLQVQRGIIQNARFNGKRLTAQKALELASALMGRRHTPAHVAEALDRVLINDRCSDRSYRPLAPELF
ncbi:LplA [Desulforapulum autotrophicum HRM2]|uniref:lipoate--protein ligase n=1 Tax=Desulforapulum autotrophicum (strain ATCC 43914 / DSM 3382 / VKM B-1955 / HRM2) TaxID=177437 RepID=C0QHE7_DESAH|nr:lipoate--protein ligase [Desulforapulum autotrophicum]ACN17806.1 LplA [Desulforapulum autotrophicum HRM2]